MTEISEVFSFFLDIRFVLIVFVGSVAGVFVGAIPGLTVTMATALLVSFTYSWNIDMAMGMIMGIYITGVYAGAITAILINIPGGPSNVITTMDGYALAKKGEALKALHSCAFYSFVGSVFGLIALWLLIRPITALALKFTPMDYFLLALFGLAAVGSLTTKSFSKGLISAMFGLTASMIGIDSVVGTPRMTFGIYDLVAGIDTIPALVGLFGFSEVLSVISEGTDKSAAATIVNTSVKIKDILKYWFIAIPACIIGTIVGALPGAGGPVASFLSYGTVKRLIKKPPVPFGEGAIEGVIASETANNACVGGNFIPMLALGIPGDAVTAIILSVFYIHGLRPGPMFLKTTPHIFRMILAGGIIGSFFMLALGLFLGTRLSKIITIPKRLMLPVVAVLCVIGAFAGNNRPFDVVIMFAFGIIGYLMRRRGYAVAPMTLGLVLGKMMDSQFRRAVSLAVSEDSLLPALFGRPITIALLALTLAVVVSNIPAIQHLFRRGKK